MPRLDITCHNRFYNMHFSQLQGQNNGQKKVSAENGRKPAETKWNDVPFTFLFVGHLALISFYAFTKGLDEVNGVKKDSGSDYKVDDTDNSTDMKMGTDGVVGLVSVLLIAIVLSLLFLKLCIRLGADLVDFTLKFTIGLEIILCLVFFATGVIIGAIIYMAIAMITMCYYRAVQDRIAFAGANLSVACTVVKRFPTLIMASFFALILNFVWLLVSGVNFVRALWRASLVACEHHTTSHHLIPSSPHFLLF